MSLAEGGPSLPHPASPVPARAAGGPSGDTGEAVLSRRRVVSGAAVLAGAAVLPQGMSRAIAAPRPGSGPDPAPGPGPSARQIGPVDTEQSQLAMVPGGNGIIYSVQADGRLKWFRHLGRETGRMSWAANGSPRDIGVGWQSYTQVLAADDGQLFGLRGDGTLVWSKYTLSNWDTGEGTWHPNTNNVIHQGFGHFAYIFGGRQGVIYAVDADGDIYWFRYLAGDGSTSPGAWADNGVGSRIATGRRDYDLHFADLDGVIYGVRHGGSLDWFRYLAGDGSNGPGAWANGGTAIPIGRGWEWGTTVERFADAGVFYCVWIDRADPARPDHELRWYRLANWRTVHLDGRPVWTSAHGVLVGTGFTTCRTANLQGYTDRWSAAPGETIAVSVSSAFPRYQVTVLRLDGPLAPGVAPDPANSQVVVAPATYAGRMRKLPAGYRSGGCGWPPDFTVTVQPGWRSGFYAVRLTGENGVRRYIPFVVRPAAPTARVAVLLPFLTHSAYNTWGGHSQYSWDEYPHRRTHTMLRPFAACNLEPSGAMDARFYGDLLLLRWLADNNIAYDCYQDLDLHRDGSWAGRYKAVVLTTHPEYWTPAMRNRLEAYLTGGGRVVNTGGNAMYERVDISADGTAVLHRDARGARWLWRDQGLPERNVIGVAYNGSFMDFAPYRVLAPGHPFLTGTGLRAGSEFGRTGYNFGASGWEMDSSNMEGPPLPGVAVLAHGTTPLGAHMVHFDRGNGGWVFSTGSVSFNGVLAHDAVASRILRNVFAAAVA
ncbi:N,N-dimethylformamidase beta subunit family domain-containing protein [Yinghuangia soli]|uniref:Tachylectin n=1 Tax=Yinghuangia soli TaxID=2908204 RepID=A0AA41PZG1_9ACTN|nr:N,N-dimethylformamidase beta subunit family domain-containing protein [Yinghuangia soli]MCF2528715.1 hypothetical protein [Yinghuangia soli]